MAKFELNKPVESTKPKVTVDAGLKPGVYVFRLVVEDQSQNKCKPDQITVRIIKPPIL